MRVDPVIPADWDGFEVRRQFRGAVYEISVRNPEGVASGVQRVTIDGQPWDGLAGAGDGERDLTLLPAFADGKVHRVEVVMGRRGGSPQSAGAARAAREV